MRFKFQEGNWCVPDAACWLFFPCSVCWPLVMDFGVKPQWTDSLYFRHAAIYWAAFLSFPTRCIFSLNWTVPESSTWPWKFPDQLTIIPGIVLNFHFPLENHPSTLSWDEHCVYLHTLWLWLSSHVHRSQVPRSFHGLPCHPLHSAQWGTHTWEDDLFRRLKAHALALSRASISLLWDSSQGVKTCCLA